MLRVLATALAVISLTTATLCFSCRAVCKTATTVTSRSRFLYTTL
jgi:hypothetical protein